MSSTQTVLVRAWPCLAASVLFSLTSACGHHGGGTTDAGSEITIPTETCDNPTRASTATCPQSTGTPLPDALTAAGAIATGGHAYVIGGTPNGTLGVTTVDVATIGTDDTLGAWMPTTSLPRATAWPAVAAAHGFIYVLGGATPGSTNTKLASVDIGTIAPDGTISGWTAGPDLPSVRVAGAATIVNDVLYFIGGYSTNNDATADSSAPVYMAPIKEDGTLGAWSSTAPVPGSGREFFGAVGHGDNIYVMAGSYNGSAVACEASKLMVGFLSSDGSVTGWAKGSSWANDMRGGAVTIVKDTLVVGGGTVLQFGPTTSTDNIVAAPINSDGSVGKWSLIGSLPHKLTLAAAAGTDTAAYFFGGQSGSAIQDATVVKVAGGTDLCSP